jgi:glutamine cyclotransferase
MIMRYFHAAPLVALAACAEAAPSQEEAADAPVYGYEIVRTYPHDTSAYTQG